jgi:hypothetical protein
MVGLVEEGPLAWYMCSRVARLVFLCKIPHTVTSLGLRGGDGEIGHLIWVASHVLV